MSLIKKYILLAICLLFMLSACGGDSSGGDDGVESSNNWDEMEWDDGDWV